jgi:hypothetical protein
MGISEVVGMEVVLLPRTIEYNAILAISFGEYVIGL